MGRSEIDGPVLVTGAGGLIGSAICRELSSTGIPVRALLATDEPPTNVDGIANVTAMRGDVRDAAAMYEAARGCFAVIHCAAINSLWHRHTEELYSVNVEGTEIACRAAMAAGVARFVFTSSCEVTGPALPGWPADEQRPLDPARVCGHYEKSKFLAEQAVRRHIMNWLPAIILRPTAVVGAGDIHGTPPGRLIRAYLDRKIPVFYDAGINVIDSKDVAKAHVAALTGGQAGETYILGAYNIRLSELFSEFARISGLRGPRFRIGYTASLFIAAAHCARSALLRTHPGVTMSGLRTVKYPWFFDSSKAERELELHARPLEETIRDAVEWHMKNPGF